MADPSRAIFKTLENITIWPATTFSPYLSAMATGPGHYRYSVLWLRSAMNVYLVAQRVRLGHYQRKLRLISHGVGAISFS